MGIKINKSKFFFFALVLVCIFLGIFFSFILPSKFYNDADLIVTDPYNEIGLIGSYPFSMFFYKITSLKYFPYFVVALIQLPILYYIIYKLGVPKKFEVFYLRNVLIYICFLLISVFLCMPSKEFINFIYIALIAYLFKTKRYSLVKTIIISFILFLFFSVFFRTYFAFIPIFSLVMYFFSFFKSKYRAINLIVITIFSAIFLSIAYGFVKGKYISQSTREAHNRERIGNDDAQSMLQSPLPTNTWYGESIGISYGYFSVNIPLNGIINHYKKPQVIAFVLWQLTLFLFLFIRFQNCLVRKEDQKYELWLFFFVFSYFMVQGLFEPDLGSAVRHKFSIFPLLYLAFYYDSFIPSREKLKY